MVSLYYILIALPCTLGAIGMAVFHIYRHLRNYTEPTYQRYIVRIIFMVPVYALMSFLSLVSPKRSIYFNSLREIYEAWVIYNFLSLCLAWVGGPGAVVLSLNGRILKPSVCLMTCCFPPMPLDGRFIRRCKQGCLQFVILKPISVALTFILYAKGKYEDGDFNANQSYLYLTIIYTISYSVALYALALFYVACRDLLKPFNPVPKFVLIKSVVFLTYWQKQFLTFGLPRRPPASGHGIQLREYWFFLAAKSGFIKDAQDAADFQDFIICVEMLIAAAGHFYAFPYKEYAGANIDVSSGLTGSLAHAVKLNDFYHDTVHQFAPTYHDYVLYNHGEGDEEGTRKYLSRTFVPTGQEMDAVRKNQHMMGGKLEDVQLSSHSTSPSSSPKDPDATIMEFAPTYHDYVLYNHGEGDEEGTRKYLSRTFVPTGQEMDAVRKNQHMMGGKLEDVQLSSHSTSPSSSPKDPDATTKPGNPESMKSSLLMETSTSVPYDMNLIDIDMSDYPAKVPAVNETGNPDNCPLHRELTVSAVEYALTHM
ncbi:Transmembrane protein 184B-like protein [Drosera capensis]